MTQPTKEIIFDCTPLSSDHSTKHEIVKVTSDVLLGMANDDDHDLLHSIEVNDSNNCMCTYVAMCFALHFLLFPIIAINFLSLDTQIVHFFWYDILLGYVNIKNAMI